MRVMGRYAFGLLDGLFGFRGGDNLGTVPYFQELERAETDSAEILEPFCSLAALVLHELLVDVVDPGSFAWLQMFDSRYSLLVAEVPREVGVCTRFSV